MPTDTFISLPTQTSRLTVAQFQARVRADLQLRGSNRITDSDILSWLNEAQDEIAEATHWFRTFGSQDQLVGVKEYNLPPGCLTIKEVWSETYKRPLVLLTPDDLQGLYWSSPNWVYASRGVPTTYYVRPGSCWGLHPTPSTSLTAEITIFYCGLPPYATLTTDHLYVPTGGEAGIIAYACWRGSLKDATGEGKAREQQFRRAWDEQLANIRSRVEALADDDVVVFGEYGQSRGRRFGPRNDWEDGTPIGPPSG